ncbi:hypothetical protein ACJX0J_023026 [Zea mays]
MLVMNVRLNNQIITFVDLDWLEIDTTIEQVNFIDNEIFHTMEEDHREATGAIRITQKNLELAITGIKERTIFILKEILLAFSHETQHYDLNAHILITIFVAHYYSIDFQELLRYLKY